MSKLTLPAARGLTISAVAARTGVSPATLRAWEERYGFPVPVRLPGGHRRYTEAEVAAIERVQEARASGRSLDAAIRVAARPVTPGGPGTVFAGLRALHPELPVVALSRAAMLRLSRAIEEECLASAERAHLGAAFQRVDRWSAAGARWQPLVAACASAVVLADFDRSRRGSGPLVEVAIDPATPLTREWSVLVASARFSAVLAGWERPDGRFEAVWTVEPDAVQDAFEVLYELARANAPELDVGPAPAPPPVAPAPRMVTASAEAVARRVVGDLA